MIRIAYPKRAPATPNGYGFNPAGYERGQAWQDLQLHQIPGAPIQIDHVLPQVRNPWRRDHTADEWAWVYVGPGPFGGEEALDEAWRAQLEAKS